MLGHLQVKNFALIEDMEIELSPGLNVITGETGAGKSLFVDAVQVALGARASTDYIRSGAEEASVWALFVLPDDDLALPMEELGIDAPEGTVLVQRDLRRHGANKARINGRLASVATVADFSRSMVELHGQHEQRGLLEPNTQRDILDAVGGHPLLQRRAEVGGLVERLREVTREQDDLLGDERERARRLDLLMYQLNEIGEADLDPAEEEDLLRRREVMAHTEDLRRISGDAVDRLSEGDPSRPAILFELGAISENLERMAGLDGDLEPIARGIQSGYLEIEEAVSSLRRYLEDLHFDEDEQRRIEERLELISGLKRKYGGSVDEVLEYGREVSSEIERIESSEEEASRLAKLREDLEVSLGDAALDLGRMRCEAAKRLKERVESELAGLHMEDTHFEARLSQREDPAGIGVGDKTVRISYTGAEEVEFLIAPNPGEPPMPLRRIASGGELARISLALESAAAAVQSPPTLIFDEIDAGVGGRAGTAVARKLAHLATTHQVLCVTHLPQIAAMADSHFHLAKETHEDRTISSAKLLDSEERVEEIARMLAGDIDRTAALEHARSMLAGARDHR